MRIATGIGIRPMVRRLFSVGCFALLWTTNARAAGNVEAGAVYLAVGFSDVTDTTSPGESVTLGGIFFWTGLDTDQITVSWFLDGGLYGSRTVTGIPTGGGYSYDGGAGPSWVATEGPHTLELVVDSIGAIAETDETDNVVSRAFTVSNNQMPTDISLTSTSIAENQSIGTSVGTLSTTDADAGDSHTYSLVSGAGSAGNGQFSISGNSLLAAAVFDHEVDDSYSVRVRTDDGNGGTYEEPFSISVSDVNEVPTNLSLTGASVLENRAAGTAVGTLGAADPDEGDTFTYSLVAGSGDTNNGDFQIVGSALQTSRGLNHEVASNLSIRIRVTDSGDLTHEEVFVVTVADEMESPPEVGDFYLGQPGEVVLQWDSHSNHTYAIEYADNAPTGFSPLVTGIAAGTSGNAYTATVSGVKCRFWRLITEP